MQEITEEPFIDKQWRADNGFLNTGEIQKKYGFGHISAVSVAFRKAHAPLPAYKKIGWNGGKVYRLDDVEKFFSTYKWRKKGGYRVVKERPVHTDFALNRGLAAEHRKVWDFIRKCVEIRGKYA